MATSRPFSQISSPQNREERRKYFLEKLRDALLAGGTPATPAEMRKRFEDAY